MSDFGRNIAELWQQRPGMVVLVVAGVAVFLFLVIDAWRRKHPPKSKRRDLDLH